LAALIKTGGLLFFIYLFILLLFKYRIKPVFLKKFAFSLAALVFVFCWFNYCFPERFFGLYTAIFVKLRAFTGVFARGDSIFNLHFFDSVMDSFYFHTGWMGFKLNTPLPWYLVLKVMLLAALIGIVLSFWVKKLKTGSLEKKWYLYALVVFGLQLFSTWFYYGRGMMAQGRYLYPVIIPVIMLIYCGLNKIERLFDFKKNYLLVFYIIFQAVFLIFALIRIVSVFYLEIASPHPGL
jgi:hypothetical protein